MKPALAKRERHPSSWRGRRPSSASRAARGGRAAQVFGDVRRLPDFEGDKPIREHLVNVPSTLTLQASFLLDRLFQAYGHERNVHFDENLNFKNQ